MMSYPLSSGSLDVIRLYFSIWDLFLLSANNMPAWREIMNFTHGICAMTLACLVFAGCQSHQNQPESRHAASSLNSVEVPGIRDDGSVLLPNQWSLRPAGKQVEMGDFPVNIALHPSGQYAAVLHCGYGTHEIVVVHLPAGTVISRVPLDNAFYGLLFAPDGKSLFASGAANEVVHRFTFADGFLSAPQKIVLRNAGTRGVPAGLAINEDGTTLYVANVWGHCVNAVDLNTSQVIWEHKFNLPGQEKSYATHAKAAPLDIAAATKRAEVAQDTTKAEDPFPYACVLDEKRGRLYVSLWARAEVAVLDVKTHEEIARWKTEEHPNEMVPGKDGRQLYVANANRNSVSVLDVETGNTIEVLVAAMTDDRNAGAAAGSTKGAAPGFVQTNAPAGNTPNSLALAPDGKTLFIANANINALSVFDVSEPGRSRSLGFIPTGWYPTSVRMTPDAKHLIVANGKGQTSRANRHGPVPGKAEPKTVNEYIGGLLQGTLSIITLPARDKFEERMSQWTAVANSCRPKSVEAYPQEAGHPIPLSPTAPQTPIKYCIYIIKENRTYDQMLGDMPEGNGDPSMCIFGQAVTPNHHALAREFVLLDNFYVDGEVSSDGHEWTMGAYATDFVEKGWPVSYGHNASGKFPYPSEGNFPIATPAGGYLWDRAREAGISYRSYGEFINNAKSTNQPNTCRVAALAGHFDPWYRSFDLNYPDALRADRFLSELGRFEKEGDMPRLQIVRLPNDHTSGTAAGKPTPVAYLADNDLALGRIIEGITRSKFWPQTAIFIIEDDAQNGSDHVDAHRSIAFVISPYTKRRTVDSTMYSTSSMLHTMELILGLKPMSQFDAAAMPMVNAFTAKPDFHPYVCKPVAVDRNARNKKTAWGADLSKKMNFAKEDAADDLILNRVIWHSVKGPDVPMPAPKRAAFLRVASAKDRDDD
jgi:DNA-binding beta-propeller fold protein YncE